MGSIPDDLFLGNFTGAQSLTFRPSGSDNPTAQIGVGPMGRVFYYNIVPLTLQVANVAALQAPTNGKALTLAAGTGATAGTAPDGSGSAVIAFDVPRSVSLTSAADLSAINFLVTFFDVYGVKQTQLMTGPNANTVNSLKAAASVLSVVPTGTSASTVSVGSSDVFGLPVRVNDAAYITQVKWDNTLAANAGTLVVADATSPATNLTGDVRGTYAQAGNASNGARRLIVAIHLDNSQCGSNPTVAALLGVTPA